MKTTRNLQLVLAIVIGLALGGCGGGGGDRNGGVSTGDGSGGNTGETIPDSALQSSDAFIAYLQKLVAMAVDNSEPINLGSARAPVSNTAEAANF
ncbi:hypothetical protein [Variovorax sp. ZT4R33]|uniref:hypothetical protein n=1 Tax=Variovorax sp. ZT4R33 TaxID=3443743 RepID=UPI003F47823A